MVCGHVWTDWPACRAAAQVGRYLLEPECWEERFGLLVALNSIGENQIKSIDKLTFDAVRHALTGQGSQEVGLSVF